MPKSLKPNLQRDTLKKLQGSNKSPLIPLRIEYSEKSKLLTGYINKLVNVNRIYPTHLPIQASGRCSTINPPITNFPRQCIEPLCQERMRDLYKTTSQSYIEHEWTDSCWSIRDIIQADEGWIMISWDHDNIEGKIHDLIVNDEEAIEAHLKGYDLHTITCCSIFGYSLPQDLRNPHTSEVDKDWRARYNWQGKDTKQRVLSKNFNHGSKYTKSWRFVYRIKGIEEYGVSYEKLGILARRYIQSKQEVWNRKIEIMNLIQKNRISKSLYGFRRCFFDSSEETGREGFSHMVSGTVSDYNYETLALLEEKYGEDTIFAHNAHDGDKVYLRKEYLSPTLKDDLKSIIERNIVYKGRSLKMTAGVKIHE